MSKTFSIEPNPRSLGRGFSIDRRPEVTRIKAINSGDNVTVIGRDGKKFTVMFSSRISENRR